MSGLTDRSARDAEGLRGRGRRVGGTACGRAGRRIPSSGPKGKDVGPGNLKAGGPARRTYALTVLRLGIIMPPRRPGPRDGRPPARGPGRARAGRPGRGAATGWITDTPHRGDRWLVAATAAAREGR